MSSQSNYTLQTNQTGMHGGFLMRKEISQPKLEVVYVGNLPPDKTQQDIQTLFGQYGEVQSVMLLTDTDSNPAEHFGWVFMGHAEDAVKSLDDANLEGRRLRVKKMGILYPNK